MLNKIIGIRVNNYCVIAITKSLVTVFTVAGYFTRQVNCCWYVKTIEFQYLGTLYNVLVSLVKGLKLCVVLQREEQHNNGQFRQKIVMRLYDL